MRVVPVHSRTTLAYRSARTFAEIRSEIEGYDYKRAFDTLTIQAAEVVLTAPTGSLRVSGRSALISAAGEAAASPIVAAAFEILERANVAPVVYIRPTAYFAVEVKGCDLATLLRSHIEMLRVPAFNMEALGRVVDTAVVFSFEAPGEDGIVNVQYGPMGRNQWGAFGGSEAEAIEDSLPAVAWGLGFFYPGPSPHFKATIPESRERLLRLVNTWRDIASQFVVE
jgi:hypothetical protein